MFVGTAFLPLVNGGAVWATRHFNIRPLCLHNLCFIELLVDEAAIARLPGVQQQDHK